MTISTRTVGYYDLIRGEAIQPQLKGDQVALSGTLPPRGIGAFLAVRGETADLLAFLAQQAEINARANFDSTPPVIHETRKPVPQTRLYTVSELSAEMAYIKEGA